MQTAAASAHLLRKTVEIFMTTLMKMIVLCLGLVIGLATGPATAQSRYVYGVQPGDTLRIEVLEDESLNRTVLVPPDGRIALPLAGSVRVSGRSVESIQAMLVRALRKNFAEAPNVFVSIASVIEPEEKEPETFPVFVLGEANTTGRIDVEHGTTILQVFSLMNGFTDFAATKRIQLRRKDPIGGERIYTLNYNLIQKGVSRNGLVHVRQDDVIVIPQRRLFEFLK